ncbi:MAG: hypothetical protein HEQ35_09170 [Gloeotrichia echinulata IR180]
MNGSSSNNQAQQTAVREIMNGSSSNNQAQQTAASQNQQTQIPISTSLPIIHQGNLSSPAVPEPSDLSLAIAGGGVVIRFNLRKRFGK